MSTARNIVQAAKERGWTVTTAESCTGGMLASVLTDVTGASSIFMQGVVTYSNDAKTALLDVKAETLTEFGAVSEEVAREMAIGAARTASADLAISVTGIAGPGGSDFKPEGRVCFGLTSPSGTRTETRDFGPLGRHQVRVAATHHALDLLGKSLAQS